MRGLSIFGSMKLFGAALIGLVLSDQHVAAAGKLSDDWDFVIAPYALAPWISGDVTLGRAGAPVEVDPGDVLGALQFAGMIHGEARHRSGFGLSFDYAFMSLGEDASSNLGSIDVDIFQGVLESYATYRFDHGENIFDAYAGMRYWNIDIDVKLSVGPVSTKLSRGDDWIDPVIGLRWQRRVAPKWRLLAQGDIGGFGIDGASDFTWSVMGGVAYDGWENVSIFAVYKALSVDYESGTPGTRSHFKYDTITQGPAIGVGFRF